MDAATLRVVLDHSPRDILFLQDKNRHTLLATAAAAGSLACMILLLDRGCTLAGAVRGDQGEHLLHLVAGSGKSSFDPDSGASQT